MIKNHAWLRPAGGIENEEKQAREEGRAMDAALIEGLRRAAQMPDSAERDALSAELYARVQACPCAHEAMEPSDLPAIRRLAKGNAKAVAPTGEALLDKIYGGWLARACGCLLGKPVEGWRTEALHPFLRETNNYPIQHYLRSDVGDSVLKAANLERSALAKRAFIDQVDCMPEDDDTNYTLISLKILENYGRDFAPEDVAECWMQNLPILHLCTAERVAYRNFVQGYEPPASATHQNAYREWIGAQIRADLYGYINPGDPATAADMAWRDACISHVKNGIYGAMWVAATIAAAFGAQTPREAICAGMNEIPPESRLHRALEDVFAWQAEGIDWEGALARVHERWDEHNGHDWCHTISNAQIVSIALLWGEMDLEKTLSIAVIPGFDTDCNGATAGSILGVMLGAKALPEKWTAPLNDTLASGVDGFGRVSIREMACRTARFVP